MKLLSVWPGLLTRGARWGGKVRLADPAHRMERPEARPALDALPEAQSALPVP